MAQELSNSKGRMVVHGPFGWGRFGCRAQGVGTDGLELRHMKCGVDAQGFGQLEADRGSVDDLNFKRAYVLGVQASC